MAAASGAGRRSRRPITLKRTPRVTHSAVCEHRYSRSRLISSRTSPAGRRQLAVEKAYSVSTETPSDGAASTTRRTTSTPARWPALRGRPRSSAQRPLPSMMIATWRSGTGVGKVLGMAKLFPIERTCVSALARGADQRLHVVQVALERLTAGRREPVLGLGNAPGERLGADDVLRFFETARVHAQVVVGGLDQRLELVEREWLVHRERAGDAEAHALVDDAIERGGAQHRIHDAHLAPPAALAVARRPLRPWCGVPSHRDASRSGCQRRCAGRRSRPPGSRCPSRPG